MNRIPRRISLLLALALFAPLAPLAGPPGPPRGAG